MPRKPFTQHEAVLLLDAYLQVRNGEISRVDAIQKVSNDLRTMARNNGEEIDESYRSVLGIRSRMTDMEIAFCATNAHIKLTLHMTTRLFFYIVALYREDKASYDKLLAEARAMVQGQETKPMQVSPNEGVENEISAEQGEAEKAETSMAGTEHKDFVNSITNYFSEFVHALKNLPNIFSRTPKQEATPQPQPKEENRYATLFRDVLAKHFANGFFLNSFGAMEKFRYQFQEMHGEPIAMTDEEANLLIATLGITCGKKLYLPEALLSDECKDKLLNYIAQTFASGKNCIFISALYNNLQNDLLDSHISNDDMLKAYLASLPNANFYVEGNKLTREKGMAIDPAEEIRNCLIENGEPMKLSKLCSALSHLPQALIQDTLKQGTDFFVLNARQEYFHLDMFELSDDDWGRISSLIDYQIRDYQYITSKELLGDIKQRCPQIYSYYSNYSDRGWFGVIRCKFQHKFSFKGIIISAYGAGLSTSQVFMARARRSQVTMQELKDLAEDLNIIVPLQAIYEVAVRVKEDLFVPRGDVQFNVKAIDDKLDQIMTGEHLPLKAINMVGFPEANFPWSVYMLESYLENDSKRFELLHHRFNQNCAIGAVARRGAYSDFDSLLADVLASCDTQLDAGKALAYLVEKGYLATKNYSNIDTLLSRANALKRARKKN